MSYQKHHQAECDLDVNFDALEVAGVEPVDLTGHTPLSEPGGDMMKLEQGALSPFAKMSPAASASMGDPHYRPQASPGCAAATVTNNIIKEDDLFFQGATYGCRTGLTPSGPMAKTPAGMLQGLSPLHNTRGASRNRQQPTPSTSTLHTTNFGAVAAGAMTTQFQPANEASLVGTSGEYTADLSIRLPASDAPSTSAQRQGDVFLVDRASRAAKCEFIAERPGVPCCLGPSGA